MERHAYTEIAQCRICGNSNLEPVLSLGTQVLTGVFPKNRNQKVSAGPLELVKCSEDGSVQTCGLLQLRHSFNPDEMFRSGYGYRSGINQTMTRHLQHIVKRILEIVELKPGDVVLDIGSNDATLLKAYPFAQISLIGIDASGERFREFYPEHIVLVPDYFSAAAFRSVAGNRKAKIVTSIAMFYDVPAPLAFMEEVKEILADDGIWVFEQSHMPTMLAMNAYDTVCHEHVEYYGLRQIKWMTDRVGFKILDVELNDINGGSFRVTAAHRHSSYQPVSERCQRLLDEEQRGGLATPKPYAKFKENTFHHREELLNVFREIRARGELALGYGASTKGNVILQFCGLTEHELPAIGDRNPEKYGCLTPGTLIPIVSEQEVRDRRPQYLLALPWHFREEFLKRESDFLGAGGRFIFPLQRIETVGR